MRVLILNQYALPRGEAGITRHGDIGAELTRRGHDVTVVASDFGHVVRSPTSRSERSRSTRHDGVEFRWIRSGAYVANDRRRIESMVRYAMLAAWTAVRSHPKPSVIIGSSPHPLAALAAMLVARLRNVPWIFEVRDIWPSALVDMQAIPRNGLAHRVLRRLERLLYANATAVVSVPPRGSLRLEELGIDAMGRHYHIPNGVAVVQKEASALPDSLGRLIRRTDDAFILAYTGTIGVMQDFDNVIAAIRILRDTNPETYRRLSVLVVGGGVAAPSSAKKAERLGLHRVHFHGAVPKAQARALLRKVDACLVSLAPADAFRYGLSPNKLFDYFAAAKPVLISSAHPTLVDEARAGIRFAPGDPWALADSIAAIANLPVSERKEMGDRGSKLIETSYSIESITDRYEALIGRVVATTSRAVS